MTAPIKNTTENSCEYTCEGLAKGEKYDLRVTTTDGAGNFSVVTTAKRTSLPIKNPNDVITDITSPEFIFPNWKEASRTALYGKTVDYSFTPKSVTFSADLSGNGTTFQENEQLTWYVLCVDKDYLWITTVGARLTLRDVNGYNNRCRSFGCNL